MSNLLSNQDIVIVPVESEHDARFRSGAFMVYTEMSLLGYSTGQIAGVMAAANWPVTEVLRELTLIGGKDPEEWPAYVKQVEDAYDRSLQDAK